MTVYKRTVWKFVTALLVVPLAPLVAWVIIMWLLQYFPYVWLYYAMFVLPAAIFVFALYNAVWGNNIRFVITQNGQMEYYKHNKLQKAYNLATVTLGYSGLKDKRGNYLSQTLRITDASGKTDEIECEPLGAVQFQKMFTQIQSFCEAEPVE